VQVTRGRRYQTWRPSIAITNTNPLIIERSASILERADVPFQIHVHPLNNPKWKQRTDITITGLRRVQRASQVIRPYVYGKAAQLAILDRLVQSRLTALSAQRVPRLGGGSEMPRWTELEYRMVADVQRLNACGRMLQA
jgi:hypothetical protein